MLSQMLLIRRFEEPPPSSTSVATASAVSATSTSAKSRHRGSVAATRPDDYLITAYRDHGHALARGTRRTVAWPSFSARRRVVQGPGRVHALFDKERFMYGGHAIIGQHLPLATGWRSPASTGARTA